MDQSDSRRTALRERINHYVGRAETIKAKTKIEISFLEQRRITAGSVGHGYDKVFSKCLDEKLTVVDVQDAYVNAHHQILNFVRFCELLVAKAPNLKTVSLLTGMESQSSKEAFRFNNGWIVKIGRGLDYFKNPGRYAIGACDLNLKPCHETTIDIFKIK